jgi:hypothetical protein
MHRVIVLGLVAAGVLATCAFAACTSTTDGGATTGCPTSTSTPDGGAGTGGSCVVSPAGVGPAGPAGGW